MPYYLLDPSLQAGRPAGLRTLWSAMFLSGLAQESLLTQWLDLALGAIDHLWIARLHNALWFPLGILGVHQLLLRRSRRRSGRRRLPAMATAWALPAECRVRQRPRWQARARRG